ncbi:MAG: prepilin-type N-terminal cleavage/methylation domain-containing protein [Bdellovibrionales bacterium]|nr:prepilin-type N-terminal cleavage/methylation domain-containing protein [Bdellovibrionales bacterium]
MRRFLNHRGFGLIEIMITLGIMGLITLGSAQLFKHVIKIQNRNSTKAAIAEVENQLRTTILNDTAWANSVNHAQNSASMGCLRETHPTGCAHNFTSAFNLFDGRNNQVYPGLTANAGYTMQGQRCNAYRGDPANPGSGNDNCPFHYQLSWTASCPPGVTPCKNPMITVSGLLLINPEDQSRTAFQFDPQNYSFDLLRGANNTRYEPLEVGHYSTSGTTGGACATGNSWARRIINHENYDLANNVTVNSANNSFQLQPGTYDCTIVAQSFDVNGWRMRLRNLTSGSINFAGSSYTPDGGTSSAMGKVRFSITAASRFVLEQQCERNGSTASFDMGRPHYYYSNGNSFTSISCIRSS